MNQQNKLSVTYRLAGELLVYSYPGLGDLIAFCIKRSYDCLILDPCFTSNSNEKENAIPKEIEELKNNLDLPPDYLRKIKQLLTIVYLSGDASVDELKCSYDLMTNANKSISVERAVAQIQILKKLQQNHKILFNYKPILSILISVTVLIAAFLIFKPDNSKWEAEYYSNPDLNGEPTLIRSEEKLKHNWHVGSPNSILPIDNFSARWTTFLEVKTPTTVTFNVTSDDGVRVIIDDETVIDSWHPQAGKKKKYSESLGIGRYKIVVEYFERFASANIDFTILTNVDNSIELSYPRER